MFWGFLEEKNPDFPFQMLGLRKWEFVEVGISKGLPNMIMFPNMFPSPSVTQAPLCLPDDCGRINLFL